MMTCAACGGEVAPALLACPSCHALVHASALTALGEQAAAAAGRCDVSTELQAWRSALQLLPPGSRQYGVVSEKIDTLSRQVTAGEGSPWKRISAGGGALTGGALILWKMKAVFLLALTKGKILLLGLGKSGTLFSMLPTFGIYWAAFGWRFAAGLIGSIYVHEIGHVVALQRYGIPATAPMFIPGVGAIVRSSHHPINAAEDARIGLAGPIWGLAAALAALGAFVVTGSPFFGAIARVGAWINLFNLLPVWQLDGARGLRPTNRTQRWLVAAAVASTFAVTREGLLVLLAALTAYHAFRSQDGGGEGDWGACAWYTGLAVVLALISGAIVTPGLS
jgi:Zn-dependent protease